MHKIIKIDETNVYIGTDEQKIITAPLTALNFDEPKLGEEVKVYSSDETIIITREEASSKDEKANEVPQGEPVGTYTYKDTQNSYTYTCNSNPNEKRINKHIFVWVGNFLFGCLGVDRFLRGQIGWGIFKLLVGWLTFYIWPLVDFIISLTKAYGSVFSNVEDLVFINGKYAR